MEDSCLLILITFTFSEVLVSDNEAIWRISFSCKRGKSKFPVTENVVTIPVTFVFPIPPTTLSMDDWTPTLTVLSNLVKVVEIPEIVTISLWNMLCGVVDMAINVLLLRVVNSKLSTSVDATLTLFIFLPTSSETSALGANPPSAGGSNKAVSPTL